MKILYTGSHIYQHSIQQGNGGHRFHNNNGSRHNDRVVSSFDRNFNIFPLVIDSLLFAENRWCRLHMGAEKNRGAVADAAQDAAGMIGV